MYITFNIQGIVWSEKIPWAGQLLNHHLLIKYDVWIQIGFKFCKKKEKGKKDFYFTL